MMAPVRRIVILGHTGFIGRTLQAHLHAEGGSEVLGFSTQTVDLRRAEAVHALADIVDARTTVVLTAAITREKGDSLQTLADNVAMAGHVAASLESHRPANCVYLSSDAVYPMRDDPITEDTPVAPTGTFYAIAKYAAECVLRRSAARTGIPLLVLRPTGVFGPGDTHNSYGPNAFLRAVVRDRSLRMFGDGEERRDHLYIGDLVRLVARLIETDAVGIYNLATGISHSFTEIVGCLRRIAPFEFTVTRMPRTGTATHRAFDVTRLCGQVRGFQFTELKQGLRETLDHLMASLERV